LASSCSRDIRDRIPAWIFSHTRGTPKNAVGWTSPTVPISWVDASWQKYVWLANLTAAYRLNMRSAMCASGR
jgi:hypothetical protein